MGYIKKCGVIAIHRSGNVIRYLIVYSKKSSKYGFPKGGQEREESFQTTAVREFYEETGYKIKNETEFNWDELSKFRIKNNMYFILKLDNDDLEQLMVDDGIQDTTEILYKKWMTLDELMRLPLNKKNFGLNHYLKYLHQQN
tara:strand:- start:952 stop:1377 length:426 start_codon:yes stop_codon:yes gene_type:complete